MRKSLQFVVLYLSHTSNMLHICCTGMCTRPFRPRPRLDPRRKGPRPRPGRWTFCPRRDRDRDIPAPETLAETCGEKISTTKSTELVNTCALCTLRGIAAVRLSVCSPSVTLRYRGHISWATSKITLRSSLLGAPTSAS